MSEPTLPSGLVEARRTPLFDFESLPDQLAESHRTTGLGRSCSSNPAPSATPTFRATLHATSASGPATPP